MVGGEEESQPGGLLRNGRIEDRLDVDAARTGMGKLEVQWSDGVVPRVQGCDVQTVGAVIAALSIPPTRKARRC
jgi:hypothetical protein